MRTFWLVLLLLPAAFAQAFTGHAVGVTDGDTITVLDSQLQQHKIRLAGIDAPEAHQPFGQKSKKNLSALVFNREVEIVGGKVDRYGRTVAKVMASSPDCNAAVCPKILDAGLNQISMGMAWWYRKYAREQAPKDREDYEVAEVNAKTKRSGLWSDKNPVPPWEWRRR